MSTTEDSLSTSLPLGTPGAAGPDETRRVRADRRSVLPWRRRHVDATLAPLLAAYRRRHPRAETDLIERAFRAARAAHAEQVRRSGEPYIQHPLGVAMIVVGLGLDDVTIAAALLHDAVEDTSLTLADIEQELGADVAMIVDGVTKLDRVQFATREDQQAATLRKMLVAMAKDIRVLLIKLADRLHNMRTIASLPPARQQRIAQETLDIYAPLAHRLGIADVKWQLEDLAFAVLHPKRYAEIEQMVATQAPERSEYLEMVLAALRDRFKELQIDAEVTGRPKHYWSIYEKMVVRSKEFDDVLDLVGVRVIVDSVKDCYGALGSIHALWKPVQGRFKDYIAMPKFNLYQSLHTTVVASQGKPVEMQIRTREMHRRAEFGIAAHWSYKEAPAPAEDLAWLQQMVDWHSETDDPAEFMQSLKLDLETDEVFVFTPQGKIITLPTGATAVDFAYTIHTEVGHRCIGVRVNGRLVPLDSTLVSGDTIEIFTSKVENAGPSRDWLGFVQTPRASSKIRQWFSRERREDAMEAGRDELTKALRRDGLPVQKIMASSVLTDVATSMHYADPPALFAAIGASHVSARVVTQHVQRELRGGEEQLPTTARRPGRTSRRTTGVHVEGLDDVLVRLSRCCTPVPGDSIVGFVTRGRGVSVHRADCANAHDLETQRDRLIEVEWDHDQPATYVVAIELEALDRSKLLRDVAQVLSEHHVNIISCTSQTSADRVAKLRFDFELADPGHLDWVLAAVKRVDAVYDAYRLLPDSATSAASADAAT
ncbi:MAG TPA: bifunctional (p)ppGpp synthetase/guanosine-3',5'-bis(diphosphate) 3'-pyrophosphohydrolase [Acidimicrobiia bacterium]|nr:bifunctional (p)ppGpp synthetase/guanosine-3',5'-bis(diphosphate) 3'-pyrophosphohydrolase [Acidimicrobiia bacterium]